VAMAEVSSAEVSQFDFVHLSVVVAAR
jgi:hypothetical protein